LVSDAFSADDGFPGFDVDGGRNGEPYVPVDAGTLVKPALTVAGIDANGDCVGAFVVEEVGDVVSAGGVAAFVKA